MGRIYDYPMASFKKALEIAEAVDALGGNCSYESCASKLNKQPTSGGFRMIVSSANKFGVVDFKKGHLHITDGYKKIKLAYSPEEKLGALRSLFFRPKVFADVYQRFAGRELPVGMLDKLLIREFSVEENMAGRVGGYLVEGLKSLALLSPNGVVLESENSGAQSEVQSTPEEAETISEAQPQSTTPNVKAAEPVLDNLHFTVRITGPGFDSTVQITEEDDLLIVQASLNKIQKKLKAAEAARDEKDL